MKSKILILDNKIYSLSKISNFLKQKKFDVIKPSETESVFNICANQNLNAVIIDMRLFGKKSSVFIQNLKDNVLPQNVKLITVSSGATAKQVFRNINS